MSDGLPKCLEYLRLGSALREFAVSTAVQAQEHIKPLHKYFALRLVLEGGFLPEEVIPRPPLICERSGRQLVLRLDEAVETHSEQNVIGGLKPKSVDVVVVKEKVGPVVAISLKGTGKAFRNLTNRMEEAVGDCTNLHLRYPALVYGFFHVLKANREGQSGFGRPDVSVCVDGSLSAGIIRYAAALEGLTGRKHWRDDPSSYERAALLMVEPIGDEAGGVYPSLPPDSPLNSDGFLQTLLQAYDLRYPLVADTILSMKRVEWSERSQIFDLLRKHAGDSVEAFLGYPLRTDATEG
jgi:hypothetical protein